MVTIGQLRAALAILRAEVEQVAAQVWRRELSGADTPGVEHAMLAGLLYRLLGAELRRALSDAPDLASLADRARAAGPGAVRLRDEDASAQAHFEAYWLTDRIAQLYDSADQVPPPLAAAAYTAEATRTLLRIHHDQDRGGRLDAGYAYWETIIEQLDRARALARSAHAAAETAPQVPAQSAPE
ncbi:hypothetical protein NDR87_26805 [Nocardia sp. CDC159]|uniref:Uncharacterized protein n=1 Tax=Nocardia pulmonis TaxID=2951408 RepID=A0A9X2EF60_9NOCA|nr:MULTISPECIES: hypothetical protein [Nocardia]MCM6777103.1 hypothetical protein [Nocardia pulmonis]MCM6789988.1 hypothetical protein [Nocardia sp. CDC159]